MKHVQARKKRSDHVGRHLPQMADIPLLQVTLKFGEVPPIGIDGIPRQSTFNTHMIEITLDQRIGIHFGR
jgi:hypothetical protein